MSKKFMERIIGREELIRVIEGLLGNFQVVGPRELPGKGVFYQPMKNARDIYLGGGFTIEPVKKFFLSPSECFFEQKRNESGEFLEEAPLAGDKRIIIGARSCEARGLTLLDKVFDSDYKDSFYINNRKRTTLIGISCDSPDKDCFCTSMGGSPTEGRGMDALIFEIGDQFIIEVISDKGSDIFGSAGSELNEEQKKLWESDKKKRKEALSRKVAVPDGLDKAFGSPYWERASSACLSCGVCTYLCPTCHCFDLVDEERKRLRCYDGCAFADFTLHASGENPRPTKKERYRQRAYHKFDYFKKNFGENLCVGCGRCIRHCPVKIDIADIVANAPLDKES